MVLSILLFIRRYLFWFTSLYIKYTKKIDAFVFLLYNISHIRELHWLPVRRRVEFKIATLVFKALNNLAPPYLVDDCNLVSDDTRRLRSATSVSYTHLTLPTNREV